MAGKTLDIYDYIQPDKVACAISDMYIVYDNKRQVKLNEWKELQKYIFATDTSKTTNSQLPWNNKTTIPKLCQIRDNLQANYLATMFPRRKWLQWLGDSEADVSKRKNIEMYMTWALDRSGFYQEAAKCVLDYVDHGNAFAMPVWKDERVIDPNGDKVGYVGPGIMRIAPYDLTMNPVAEDFKRSPKIVRSVVSIGEVKKIVESEQDETVRDEARKTFDYMLNTRANFSQFGGHGGQYVAQGQDIKDTIFNISGFDDWRGYLGSDYAELLTFYGDYFDHETREIHENMIVIIVDRHKLLVKKKNPTVYGYPPIFHSGWRIRQDNLWAMGPLDNLVGMQYRIDHLENLKADCFDQIAFPPLKVRGYVEDFEWGPFERIYVGDDGDVEVMSPNVQVLQADNQIALLEAKMEEMAGSPKEAMGFRTPGEKTAYEVQRLENAASRIFQSKISQFEQQLVEPLLNGMLELARRYMDRTEVQSFDPEFNVDTFKSLTKTDITGNGTIRPVAARYYAEQATIVQDLNNFMLSPAYQDPDVRMHFSSIGLARLFEQMLHLEDFETVQENVRLAEKADAQKEMQMHGERLATESQTPVGVAPDDAAAPF